MPLRRSASRKSSSEPHVGIFFYVDRALHIESTPWSQAEHRGEDFLIHPGDHAAYWEMTLRSALPEHKLKSYDFFPRGRVAYSVRDYRFLLFHDICIPQAKVLEIMELMNLPAARTKIDLDGHYRCAGCNKNYVSDAIWED